MTWRIWVRSTLEVGYVAAVAILAIVATWDPNHISFPAFDLTIGLSLPGLVPLLPVFYGVVGNVWNLTGADHGGATGPVTAAYVVMFSLAATVNVLLVNLVTSARRGSRRRPRRTQRAAAGR